MEKNFYPHSQCGQQEIQLQTKGKKFQGFQIARKTKGSITTKGFQLGKVKNLITAVVLKLFMDLKKSVRLKDVCAIRNL